MTTSSIATDNKLGGSETLPPPTGGWLTPDVCNAKLSVTAAVTRYTEGMEPESCAEIRLDFPDGAEYKQFIVSMAAIEDYDWHKIPGCLLFPPYKKSKLHLAQLICEALPKVPPKVLHHINKLGNCRVDEEHVYNTGGELIRPSPGADDGPKIELAPCSFTVDTDPNLTEDAAAAGMMELITLFANAGRIMLAHMLLYLMSAVYAAVWKFPCTCVFLYGKTGTKKTTASAFLTQLFNRRKGILSPVRLNASIPAAVRILYEKRDTVAVLDDLFPAESKDLKRKQEEVLYEITRVIADGIPPARMRGKEVAKDPPTSGVLFTGEYVIGVGSNAARLLPVEMQPPDCERLKYFQDQPLLVSTFYRNFIQWYINSYGDIKEYLGEWLDVYRDTDLGVHDRLQETHFFLNTSYALLLQYCFELDIITKQDARKMHSAFVELLTGLVEAQQHRVDQGRLSTDGEPDYLAQIRTLYKAGRFYLAPSAAQFDDKAHDGVVHNGELCLRKKRLQRFFSTVSLDNVKDSLLRQGALRRGADRDEIQIGPAMGKRFYAIPLQHLQ